MGRCGRWAGKHRRSIGKRCYPTPVPHFIFPLVCLCNRLSLQRAYELTDVLNPTFVSVSTNTLNDFNTGIGIDKAAVPT